MAIAKISCLAPSTDVRFAGNQLLSRQSRLLKPSNRRVLGGLPTTRSNGLPPPVPAPELKPRETQGPRTVSRTDPGVDPDARKVLAASSRIEANVKIGPTSQHSLFSIGGSVLAVVALIVGAVLGYPTAEVVASPSDLPTPSTLAITDTNTFSIDADGVAAVAEPMMVQLTLTGCGTRSKAPGFITENSLIVASRTALLRDTSPIVTLADGTVLNAQVIGWSRELDIAVLSSNGPIPSGLTWGSSRRLKVGGESAIIESFLDQVSGRNARIGDVETRDGLVVTFGFENASLRGGSPALNEFAAVLGVINTAGRLVPAEDIRAAIGEFRVDPQNPSNECG